MAFLGQYPWRTRIGWHCRGYMYYVDVCEAECLDVARALWLTGAEAMTLYVRGEPDGTIGWLFIAPLQRGVMAGGYSNN